MLLRGQEIYLPPKVYFTGIIKAVSYKCITL